MPTQHLSPAASPRYSRRWVGGVVLGHRLGYRRGLVRSYVPARRLRRLVTPGDTRLLYSHRRAGIGWVAVLYRLGLVVNCHAHLSSQGGIASCCTIAIAAQLVPFLVRLLLPSDISQKVSATSSLASLLRLCRQPNG